MQQNESQTDHYWNQWWLHEHSLHHLLTSQCLKSFTIKHRLKLNFHGIDSYHAFNDICWVPNTWSERCFTLDTDLRRVQEQRQHNGFFAGNFVLSHGDQRSDLFSVGFFFPFKWKEGVHSEAIKSKDDIALLDNELSYRSKKTTGNFHKAVEGKVNVRCNSMSLQLGEWI